MERLDEGARGQLTLVSAPAGFGKTTLVAEVGLTLWLLVRGVKGADPAAPSRHCTAKEYPWRP
jgi:hypothetical protein